MIPTPRSASSRPRATVLRMPPRQPAAPLQMECVAPPEPVVTDDLGGTGGDGHGAPLQGPPPGPLSGIALPAPGEEEEERLRAALVLGKDEEAFGDGEKFQEENVAEPLGVTRAAHLPSPVEAQGDPATCHGEWWAAVEASMLAPTVDTARAAAVAAGSGDEDEDEDDVRGSGVHSDEEEDVAARTAASAASHCVAAKAGTARAAANSTKGKAPVSGDITDD